MSFQYFYQGPQITCNAHFVFDVLPHHVNNKIILSWKISYKENLTFWAQIDAEHLYFSNFPSLIDVLDHILSKDELWTAFENDWKNAFKSSQSFD